MYWRMKTIEYRLGCRMFNINLGVKLYVHLFALCTVIGEMSQLWVVISVPGSMSQL